ncbi:MAG: FG-GAP-like repeat-containing protein [Anaerolineales bacterium]
MRPGRIQRWLSIGAVIIAAMFLSVAVLAFAEKQVGIEKTRLTVAFPENRDSRSASTSADGVLVAFYSDSDLLGQGIPDNQNEIWLCNTATLTHTRITTATDTDRDSFNPQLSADGSMLAFYSDADFLSEGIANDQNEVWLYNINQKSYTRITMASDDANRDSWDVSVNSDGTVIAYSSDSDFLGQGIKDDQFEIWLYDTATMMYTRATIASNDDRGSYKPHINAQGTLVAFSSDSDFLEQGIEDEQSEIWLYDVNSSSLTRVTYAPDSSRGSYAPSLSADGSLLTFISDVDILGEGIEAGQYEVWLYYLDSGEYTRVTHLPTSRYNDFPTLNADGTRLAFHSDGDFLDDGDTPDGQYEIWLYDVPAGSLSRVTVASEPFRKSLRPSLTAAGDKVAFESSSDFLGEGVDSEEYEIWMFSLPLPSPSLSKAVNDTQLQPGQRITYTLVAANPLDMGLSNAVISDTLPSGLTFAGPVSLEPPQTGAVLAQSAEDLPTLASALKIPAGSAITVTFPVTVNPDIAWSTAITNTASLTSLQVPTPTYSSVAAYVRFQIISVSPLANSHDASLDTDLTFAANDSLDGNTVLPASIAVHAGYQGRFNDLSISGDAVLDPAADFHPGELVQTTVTADVHSASDVPIVPYVWTFNAATLGGSGAFEPHPVVPSLSTFQSIGVGLGDLDADGDLDAVLANGSDYPETVWLNDGTGALTRHPSSPEFGLGESRDVALGDLDSDGDLDAIVANAITDTVWINNGSGGFSPHPTIPTLGSENSRHVVLGDLDGDGDLDTIFAHFNHPDTVWLNDGSGGFTPHPTKPSFGMGSSFDVVLGDLDNDGDLDALVTKTFLPNTIWLNDGTGSFSYKGTFDSGASYGLATGDVDGDGDLDAVVAKSSDQPETVWVNDGTGRLTPHPTTPKFGAGDSYDVALGDLDGDGDLDAVVVNGIDHPQTAWLNDGLGNFTAQQDTPNFGAGYSSCAVLGDLDGDGDLDTIIGDSSSLDATVWLNRNLYKIMLPLLLRDFPE